MPLTFTFNPAEVAAQRNLTSATTSLARSRERLGTGLRINRASDDAAGLAISEKLVNQRRGMLVAMRNANDAVSYLQTAEGALAETSTLLQRMRELAVQASNGSLGGYDRAAIQTEVSQIVGELGSTVGRTIFNGKKVLEDTAELSIQVGANSGETLGVTLMDATWTALGVGSTTYTTKVEEVGQIPNNPVVGPFIWSIASFKLGVSGGPLVDVASAANGGTVSYTHDGWLNTPGHAEYEKGIAKSLAARINSLSAQGVAGLTGVSATAKSVFTAADLGFSTADAYVGAGSLAAGDFKIKGVDVGPVTVQNKDADGALRNAINSKSSTTGVVASLDANGGLVLTADDGRDILLFGNTSNNNGRLLFNGKTRIFQTIAKSGDVAISAGGVLQIESPNRGTITESNATFTEHGVSGADVSTVAGAQTTMDAVDRGLEQLSRWRASVGAYQNRVESIMSNLAVASQTAAAATSSVRDADLAEESAAASRSEVLQRAAMSVLAHANTSSQYALRLLR